MQSTVPVSSASSGVRSYDDEANVRLSDLPEDYFDDLLNLSQIKKEPESHIVDPVAMDVQTDGSIKPQTKTNELAGPRKRKLETDFTSQDNPRRKNSISSPHHLVKAADISAPQSRMPCSNERVLFTRNVHNLLQNGTEKSSAVEARETTLKASSSTPRLDAGVKANPVCRETAVQCSMMNGCNLCQAGCETCRAHRQLIEVAEKLVEREPPSVRLHMGTLLNFIKEGGRRGSNLWSYHADITKNGGFKPSKKQKKEERKQFELQLKQFSDKIQM